MKFCLACDTAVEQFISFGRMPIANAFLTSEQFESEYFFEMRVGFCPGCGMVQLLEQPDPKKMFHDNYAFFSSTSIRMAEHFSDFATFIRSKYLKEENPFVVEIGSNDGILLQNFASMKIRHLGIEPSSNVAEVARSKGVNSISDFFEANLAKKIVSEYGQADAFLGANVMCHVPDLHSVAEGVRLLLKPKGVMVFEDPYLGDILEKTSYDQIYDEHASYFSVMSVSALFARHGMEVIDASSQNVHGGSMRYVIAHRGAYPVSDIVRSLLGKEERMALRSSKTYAIFKQNIEVSRDRLMKFLHDFKAEGKRVVGYAATSKSTTVTNYCGITPDLLEFISDTTPIKQGKFSPGVHIPIKSYEAFKTSYPDYALLFGWNHSAEIMAKEQDFKKSRGQWLVYVPRVEVLI